MNMSPAAKPLCKFGYVSIFIASKADFCASAAQLVHKYRNLNALNLPGIVDEAVRILSFCAAFFNIFF